MKCDRELAPVDRIICNSRVQCELAHEFRKAVRGVKAICTDVKLIAEGEQQLVSAVGNPVDRRYLPCTDDERKNLPVCLNVHELRDCLTACGTAAGGNVPSETGATEGDSEEEFLAIAAMITSSAITDAAAMPMLRIDSPLFDATNGFGTAAWHAPHLYTPVSLRLYRRLRR